MISQLEASTDKMTPTQTYHDDEPAWTLQLMIENRAGIVLMLNQKFSNASVMGTKWRYKNRYQKPHWPLKNR